MTHATIYFVVGNQYRIVRTLLFLALLTFQAAQGQLCTNIFITASDGVLLDATITRPLGFPPSGGFPSLVLVHGFGGSKDDMAQLSFALASYGYASMAYSVRGQGNSGGLSTVDGERERQDLLEVIQYFRNARWIHPNRLGVAGGSQGGIHSYLAAVYRMPGVKAIAPLLATPDFARALVPNGCVAYGLPLELTLGSVRYSSDRDRIRDFIIADQFDSVLAYIDQRDLAHLVDSIRIPVFQGLGWADFLFPVNGGISARQRLADRRIPVWSYFGTNGHGEPLDLVEAAFILDKMVSWFDHWLRGFSLSQDSVPMVFYSDDRPNWPHHTAATWPPQPSYTLRLYLTQNGLSQTPSVESATFSFSLDYNSNYTPAMGWDDLYGGSAFVSAFVSSNARLVSDPLQSNVEVTGIPSGRIQVQSDATKFQAHVRCFDVVRVDTGFVWKLMSRSVNGVRGNTPGQTHEIALQGTALSHIVPAGHRVGIEITSLDMAGGNQAHTVPYFVSSHSTLLSPTPAPSYIDLPIVGTPAIVQQEGASSPSGQITLLRNYPNPFNPKTTIEFGLAAAGEVSLKVFNIIGKEVATLVKGQQDPGIHTVTWDASEFPSGMYIYQLQAGRAVSTNKLMLVK